MKLYIKPIILSLLLTACGNPAAYTLFKTGADGAVREVVKIFAESEIAEENHKACFMAKLEMEKEETSAKYWCEQGEHSG